MMVKKIVTLGMLLLVMVSRLNAVHVVITNTLNDAHEHKKIWFRLGLSGQECALVKNTVQFSVDSPEVVLWSWHPLIEPTTMFIEAFKKHRSVFAGPFSGWIAGDYGKESSIGVYASGLVVTTEGKVKPFGCGAFLGTRVIPRPSVEEYAPPTQLPHTMRTIHGAPPNLKKHFFSIEKSERQWNALCSSFASVAWWKIFLWIDSCLMILMMASFVRFYRRWRNIPVPCWVRRDKRLYEACVGLVGLNIGWIGWLLLTRYIAVGLSAVLCGSVFIYVLMVPGREDTLWGKFKNISGIICGILVMPLILKTLLLLYGLG
jgi:hypothetical protein